MLTIKETETGRAYEITKNSDPDKKVALEFINATTGGILTNESLLFVLIMRLKALNQELTCDENAEAIDLLVKTTEVLERRAQRMKEAFGQPVGIAEVSSAPTKTPESEGPVLGGVLGQLHNARTLLTEVHALSSDEVKQLIEERTGPWMVWGVNQHGPMR